MYNYFCNYTNPVKNSTTILLNQKKRRQGITVEIEGEQLTNYVSININQKKELHQFSVTP